MRGATESPEPSGSDLPTDQPFTDALEVDSGQVPDRVSPQPGGLEPADPAVGPADGELVTAGSADDIGSTPQSTERRATLRHQLVAPLVVYSLLRFGLTAALTAVLMLFVPFLIALVLAVVLQLPLALLLFGPQRAKVNALTAELTAERRSERDRLRAALHGGGDRPADV